MGDAINRYVNESNKQIGRTKTQVLKSIKTFDIAEMHCDAITSADIVAFAQEKLDTGVQPQTVSNYMSHLAAVFSIARPAWGYPLNQQAMEDARKVTDRLHDLRHDGVSRLFELGLNIPHVAANSGHRSWTSLKRYTHLRQTGDKYADWKWLPEVTKLDNTISLVKNGKHPRRRRSERGV